ncbi:MAG: Abi family protein [Treponema sp.]|nr:Abi family protein [Treponema sp.]
MQKIPFNKPALSISQQIAQLESRGMIIADKALAEKALRNLNYYRLSGYWMHFEDCRDPHHFKPGTAFEEVLSLYEFEKSLRQLCFEGISRLEVSFRTQWAHQMGMKYGSHSYLQPEYCNDFSDWLDNMKKIQSEFGRSKEPFINHYKTKYAESFPPVWVVCEILSFGTLSCWYMNLANVQSKNPNCPGSAKDEMANFYGADSSVLESWMHSLSVLRNHCAHQSRVILKALPIQPMRPKSAKVSISSLWQSNSSLHNLILILVYLNDRIEPHSMWRTELLEFLSNNSQKAVEFLGFPTGWQSKLYWKV